MNQPERPRFDLTREPWIPCEALDGSRVDLGFEDVLLRAHELGGVHDESPLATAMIHRLLLAVLHRVVDGPRSFAEWGTLWAQQRFDAGRVRAYFERWRHRFDLFDAERPFFQVPRLAEVMFKERGQMAKVNTIRRVALDRSNYSNAVHLLEHGGDEIALSPSEALRAMLGFIGFGPGGRIDNDSGYPEECPLRSGVVVLARGETAHRTLLLNLLVLEQDKPLPTCNDDAPAWEQDAPAAREKRTVRGWLDVLTWQARRVELLPVLGPRGITIRDAITGVGLQEEGSSSEPMQAFLVRDAGKGAQALRFERGREPWRDATALFEAAGPDGHRRPAVCDQIAKLVEDDVLDRTQILQVQLFGLSGKQARIHLWRIERMPLPPQLLIVPELLEVVRSALAAAESAEAALAKSAWLLARYTLASGNRSPDKKDIGALVDRLDAKPRYWAALGARFDSFVRELGGAEDPETALVAWKATALGAARRALDDAAGQLGSQARALQARALAERQLTRELAEFSPRPAPPPTQEGASA
jgi:CRISPR system Cascade subunit CasA